MTNKTINNNSIINNEKDLSFLYKKRFLKKINNITLETSFPHQYTNYIVYILYS